MKAIYKMEIPCGRQGTLYGIFVADTEKVKALFEEQTEVYFGEVLGKHSDVEVIFQEDDVELTLVSSDPKVVKMFEANKMETGYNPFDYLDEED